MNGKKDAAGKAGQRQGLSLSVKIYILIILSIVTVSVALLYTCYSTFSDNVDKAYQNRTGKAAIAGSAFIPSDVLEHFWQTIRSEEYLRTKKEAVAAGDEEILLQWMRSRPGFISEISGAEEDPGPEEDYSLYDEFSMLNLKCGQIRDTFEVADAYVQKTVNGVTYNVIDPNEDVFYVGSIEEQMEEFTHYGDNGYVPPTIYSSRFGWLCTSCQPISQEEGVFGLFCVDTDMNEVIKEQYRFLARILIFVLFEIAAAIVISMVVIRSSFTRPLTLLANAARDFADNNEGISREDVIQLPIRSSDEIGTLYHEIQSMQDRIVDYTDHIRRITAEEEHIRAEMSLAARIQKAALPKSFDLPTEKVDLYAIMHPARKISGDFYDFFLCGEDRLCLVIADVSGKGIPASLFMMRAKTAIKHNARSGLGPAELMGKVNNVLCEENDENMFVTVWLGILELKTGIMHCSNAGHEYPEILHSGGSYEMLTDEHGMALGTIEDNSFPEYEIRLEPGDRIFVYTDGVTEAVNENREQYREERLREKLNSGKDADQKTLLKGVLQDIVGFAGAAEQFDDITMVGLTYNGDSA